MIIQRKKIITIIPKKVHSLLTFVQRFEMKHMRRG